MSGDQVMSVDAFARRLADLCLRSGLSGLPRDPASLHVLFTNAVGGLAADALLEERTVNAALAAWIETSGLAELDHVTLRRRLVDAGYLDRTDDGRGYRVAADPPGRPAFAPGAERVDLKSALAARREEAARRKAEYLARAGQ